MHALRSIFYICPICFFCSEEIDRSHQHRMLKVNAGKPGDRRRHPLTDSSGHMVSRAPRWFHEAVEQQRLKK